MLERSFDDIGADELAPGGRFLDRPGAVPTVRAHCDAVELSELLLGVPPAQLARDEHVLDGATELREGSRRSRRRRAGLPPMIDHGGTSLVTTAPAARTLCPPTCTPSRTTTLLPIQTSSPTVMPRTVSGWRYTGSAGSNEWLKPISEECAPIRTPLPSRTVPRTTANGFTVQWSPVSMSPVTYACAAMYESAPSRSESGSTIARSETKQRSPIAIPPRVSSSLWRCCCAACSAGSASCQYSQGE